MEKMAQERIDEKLQKQSEWSQIGDSIQRTYRFDDFLGAMTFVRRVAELAESQQHHPDILIRYDKVTLTLSTHDVGGISDKDFNFASSTDGCAAVA